MGSKGRKSFGESRQLWKIRATPWHSVVTILEANKTGALGVRSKDILSTAYDNSAY